MLLRLKVIAVSNDYLIRESFRQEVRDDKVHREKTQREAKTDVMKFANQDR